MKINNELKKLHKLPKTEEKIILDYIIENTNNKKIKWNYEIINDFLNYRPSFYCTLSKHDEIGMNVYDVEGTGRIIILIEQVITTICIIELDEKQGDEFIKILMKNINLEDHLIDKEKAKKDLFNLIYEKHDKDVKSIKRH